MNFLNEFLILFIFIFLFLGLIYLWFLHKKDQKALIIAKKNTEKAQLAKKYFLDNVSHEIRTPLGIIIGYLDIIKNTKEKDVEPYMEIVEKNSQQLVKIIDDILETSKITEDNMSLNIQSFAIGDLLSEIYRVQRPLAEERGIEFEILFNSELPSYIKSDRLRIKQILINLLNNAMKFTSQGSIKLCIFVDSKDRLTFEVRDTGYGVTPEYAENIFKPFSQEDESTTRRYGGIGLGLTLSKKIAESMGGQLYLKFSKRGQGSVFTLSIPFEYINTLQSTSLPKHIKSVTKKQDLPLEGVHILVIEDSIDNQRIVKSILTRNGATVESANDGCEGFEKAVGNPKHYDLVLMDIQMPCMDGYQTTEKLRAAGFEQPIIALTAHSMKEEKQKCFDVGCSEHLTKPVNKTELIDTIYRHVQ